MRKFTDSELLDRVASLDTFRGFPQKSLLDIWVRSRADEFDRFDDKVFTFEPVTGKATPRFVSVNTGTSNAGAEGLKNFAKYNRLGCAILKADIIVYESHAPGLHKGQYPAYRQVKGFPYFRDADKDTRAEQIGPEYDDIIGANCHRAGQFSTYIGGWSVACLVRNQRAQWDNWFKFMNRRLLSVSILSEFD